MLSRVAAVTGVGRGGREKGGASLSVLEIISERDLLTPGGALRTLPALFCERSGGRADHHETHLSAEQDQAQTRHRIPRPHEDDWRRESSFAPSLEGTQEDRSVTERAPRAGGHAAP